MVRSREAVSGSVWLDGLELLVEINESIQRIWYFQSKEFGKMLVINDELQRVEVWAPFYHEVVVHLPCLLIVDPSIALILGGSNLCAAAKLLKYYSIKSIGLVDYDPNIIEATSRIYPETDAILRAARLNIVMQECKKYLNNCIKQYDLLINDCFELYAEDEELGYDLYEVLYDRISEVGICSNLIYRSIYRDGHTQNAPRRIAAYENRAMTLLAVPEYPGFLHLLTTWGKNLNVRQQQRQLINPKQSSMRDRSMFKIYSPKHLSFYLYLPSYLSSFS